MKLFRVATGDAFFHVSRAALMASDPLPLVADFACEGDDPPAAGS